MKTIKQLSDMKGQRVLITGGAGHLGRAISSALGELGATIVLVDRSEHNLQLAKENLLNTLEVDCAAIACDLEDEKQRLELISQIRGDKKGLCCLINNAAFTGTSALDGWISELDKQSLNVWRRAIEVNLTAPFHLSQAFAPMLKEAKFGNIINITSIYGDLGPDWSLYEGTQMGNPAAYAASKGGLAQMTRWLATTLAPHIRVNAISPGGIFRDQPEVFVSRYSKKTPLSRMATEEDFKGVISFLASGLSTYVTGQIIKVDGGWSEW